MPRPPKLSNQQAMEVINSVWPSGQTEIEAATIRESLENSGNAHVLQSFRNLKSAGLLRGFVRLTEDGKTRHVIARGDS